MRKLQLLVAACIACIGLDAMAYNAYRGPERLDDLARTARQVTELLP